VQAGGPIDVAIFREQQATSGFGFLNELLEGRGITRTLQSELDKAGSKQTAGVWVLIFAVSTAAGIALGASYAGLFGAVIAGAVGAFVPFAVIKKQQTNRAKRIGEQLPEAIEMMVNALKAGYSLQAAMRFIGDEVGAPVGPEFARFYDEQRLGMEVRQALMNMQERLGTLDVRMFVTALLIQRETGGNLAEIMTTLSTLMRERLALRGQIDVLTAEPKMSAVVLTLMPICLFGVINVTNRDYVQTLYTTEQGRSLLIYGAASIMVGYYALQRIGDIEI
jgi:tight adherence protein B